MFFQVILRTPQYREFLSSPPLFLSLSLSLPPCMKGTQSVASSHSVLCCHGNNLLGANTSASEVEQRLKLEREERREERGEERRVEQRRERRKERREAREERGERREKKRGEKKRERREERGAERVERRTSGSSNTVGLDQTAVKPATKGSLYRPPSLLAGL